MIIFRPSVDRESSYDAQQLLSAFEEQKLIDKTVCEDRIVYIFGDTI